jgi:hypothetical protein
MRKRFLQMKTMAKAMMIVLLLGAVGKMYAYDFSAVCETGQTLYYNVIDADNHYVEVTYPGNSGLSMAWSGYTKPVGSLIIPSFVTHYSLTYMVTSIGNSAFYGCNLNSVTIGNNVTLIDDYAYYACNGLYTMTIPNSINQIGDDVFENCGALTTVYYTGTIEEWCEIKFSNNRSNPLYYATSLYVDNNLVSDLEIPNSVTEIKDFAFFGYRGLNSVVTGNHVTSIGRSAFFYCDELISVKIANSVVSIGNGTFQHCTNLTSLVIPNSMASIGFGAFWGCTNLTTIIMLGTTEPSLGDYAFQNNNATIYVPYESLNDYKTATNWSNYANRIKGWLQTTIPGYNEGNNSWQFIASPLAENSAPTMVDNMITETTYDLYRFNQSVELEWQNYKAHTNDFTLANGQGYLYANAEDVNLIFKGEFNEDETKEVELAYDANADLSGWNLVGNPFPVSAYANRSYYVMNEDGTAIEPVAVSMGTVIPFCTGMMVKADNTGETVTFSKTAPETAVNQGVLQIAVAQANQRGASTGSATASDKAIVSFNAGDRLEKFVFNEDNATLSIPQGGKDFAIANAEKMGEMPLNFKAAKNGEYTITVNPEAVEMDYLHLIDNMTGNDIDLLASPSYSFNAKTTDYESRFKLVFSTNNTDGPSTGSGTFAFISNGNIIINGEGTVQVIDMAGHIIVSVDEYTRSIPTAGMTSGVYVLRLIEGDDVKTQKIVVR